MSPGLKLDDYEVQPMYGVVGGGGVTGPSRKISAFFPIASTVTSSGEEAFIATCSDAADADLVSGGCMIFTVEFGFSWTSTSTYTHQMEAGTNVIPDCHDVSDEHDDGDGGAGPPKIPRRSPPPNSPRLRSASEESPFSEPARALLPPRRLPCCRLALRHQRVNAGARVTTSCMDFRT